MLSQHSMLGRHVSFSDFVWLIATALFVVAVGDIIYKAYFHPLSRYPGPKLYGATHLCYMYHAMKGEVPMMCLKLHKQYGDIVRIAPDELSYNTGAAWKDIYGHRSGHVEMLKDPRFYGRLPNHREGILCAETADHSRLRRILAPAFSDKTLAEQEYIVKFHVDLLVKKLNESLRTGKHIVDMGARYNWTTFDIMGSVAFGESFGCLEQSKNHPWIEIVFDNLKAGGYLAAASRSSITRALLRRCIPNSLRTKKAKYHKLTLEMVNKRLGMKTGRRDFMGCILQHYRSKEDMNMNELCANASIFITGGSETTATLLSGATYYLLKFPLALQKLTHEIRSAFNSDDEITVRSLASLRYLHAVIEETLRIYPPGPSGIPRIVGGGGDYICGNWVPEGTSVSVGHYASYHDPKNFTLPEEFIPERFLPDSALATHNKEVLQPFSFGPRSCIGKSFAYATSKLILARIILHFDMELVDKFSDWRAGQKVYMIWEKGALHVKLTLKS